jgi:hypothetical protein
MAKRGRPPLGERALTGAERQRRFREREREKLAAEKQAVEKDQAEQRPQRRVTGGWS